MYLKHYGETVEISVSAFSFISDLVLKLNV